MTINLDDIIKVNIPDEVVEGAKELSPKLFGDKKASKKHRPLQVDHDEIGLIGHWAVEVVLTRWQIPFNSTRRTRYQSGDGYDIAVLEKLTDVKSTTMGKFTDKYFYNMDFFLFKDWADDPKGDVIDDYIFVHIDNEVTEARVFGVLARERLMQCPIIGPCSFPPANLKYENYHVKAHNLTSLYKYIYK